MGNTLDDSISDSPLLTPKDPPLRKMQIPGAGNNLPTIVEQQNSESKVDQSTNSESAGAKNNAWKDRLSKLRAQKELKKQ